jgi:hypothetical protein
MSSPAAAALGLGVSCATIRMLSSLLGYDDEPYPLPASASGWPIRRDVCHDCRC